MSAVAPNANRQAKRVLQILQRGPIKNHELVRECLTIGVTNPRARVSDLRKHGVEVIVERGVYRLGRVNYWPQRRSPAEEPTA